MQFIRGSDLAAILNEEGRLRPYRAIDVCRQVASALDAAHGMALIHRDVKPGNVLIEGRRAYLTDFGLTKRSGGSKSGLTQAGELVGTIHYVAPGADRGRRRRRAHRRLLARLPALPLPDRATCRSSATPTWRSSTRTCRETPPKLTDVRPELPAGLDAVIAKGARQVARPALPVLQRPDVGGARGDRRRRAAGRHRAGARRARGRRRARRGDRGRAASCRRRDGAPTVVPDAERRARMLLAGLDQRTQAIVQVAVGDALRGRAGAARARTCSRRSATAGRT